PSPRQSASRSLPDPPQWDRLRHPPLLRPPLRQRQHQLPSVSGSARPQGPHTSRRRLRWLPRSQRSTRRLAPLGGSLRRRLRLISTNILLVTYCVMARPKEIPLRSFTAKNILLVREDRAMAKITLTGWRCERCGHTWVPKSETTGEPRVCPKCKSPYWNRP